MQKKRLIIMLALLTTLALSACGGSAAEATPTVNVQLVRTQAVMTYQVQLTQTAIALPTNTPTMTQSPTPAATFSLATAGTPSTAVTIPVTGGSPSACYGLAFVTDVTIDDGTRMTPGQSFTKTWRVSNTGTCAWEPGFVWNVVAGDAMGGTAVTLNQRVEPGQQFEFSVAMVAPTNKTGEIEGDWRLSDASGQFFGEAPWVKIVVGSGGPAATATTGAPATATPTPTQ